MDQKSCKEKLKLARETIKLKQFDETLKLCEELLSVDSKNYNALVFEGAAREGLQQPIQALLAYQKAVKLDPSTVLAWQGICKVYETFRPQDKQGKAEQIEAYEKMLPVLASNTKKCFEVTVNLVELYLSTNQYELALSGCERLMASSEWVSTQGYSVYHVLVLALSHIDNWTEKQLEQFKQAAAAVLSSASLDANEKQTCVDNLFKHSNDATLVWNSCRDALETQPNDIPLLEILHNIFFDSVVAGDATFALGCYTNRLSGLQSDNIWLKLIESHEKFTGQDLPGALALLEQGLKLKNELVSALVLNAKCTSRLHSQQSALTSISEALSLLDGGSVHFGNRQKTHAILSMTRAQVWTASYKKDHWSSAVGLCNDLQQCGLIDEKEILLCKAHAMVKLGDYSNAEEIISSLIERVASSEALALNGFCKLHQMDLPSALSSLDEAVRLDGSNAKAHHYLGLVYWHRLKSNLSDTEAKEGCLRHLIQAAKIDPHFAETFLYLGYYYENVVQDLGKAKRCYQKAYDLDYELPEVGNSLVSCLMELNEEEAALKFLQAIVARQSSCKWAWLRMGIYQMKHNDLASAISSLQMALRLDPSDSHCWECLGDAYMNRGSYSTALKAFNKALELNSNAVYCSYQLACIKQKLGQLVEAIDQYNVTLKISPDYVPALQGLGVTHLLKASVNISRFLHGRGALHCQMAISNLARAVTLRPDLSCVWKHLGDACSTLHGAPENVARISVPSSLLPNLPMKGDGVVELNKNDLLALGSRCYASAINLRPTVASLWHDLGVNYFYQAKNSDPISAADLAQKSSEVLKKSIMLEEANAEHWNSLGVVSASKEVKDYSLAQHCFIKSIQCESNNVCAWTNLGTLYLFNNHKELAHEAFKVAQSLEPDYVACWIGQAMIAEKLSDSNEAMDLFRHTTEIGYHREAMLGYAHWVCKLLQNKSLTTSTWYQYAMVQMDAVTAAIDAVSKYLDQVPDDALAWNLAGILFEQKRLYRPGVNALARCVKLLESSDNGSETLSSVRINYARLLAASGNYTEAILQYESMLKKGESFEILSGLALSFFKSNQIDESCKAYKKAWNLADENDQQLVSVAMAMCAYQSEDFQTAQEILFTCLKATGRSPLLDVLKALLCVGLIQRDQTLTGAVMEEFKKSTNICLRSDLALLLAWSKLLEGDQSGAVSLLVRDVHRNPNVTACWTQLGQFLLLNLAEKYTSSITHCGHVTLLGDVTVRQAGLQCLTLAQRVCRKSNNSVSAFTSAKKLVHIRPDEISSWCLLLATSHDENVQRILSNRQQVELQAFTLQCSLRILGRAESELKHGGVTGAAKQTLESTHLWCAQLYAIALITAGHHQQAKKFLQQASWLYESDEMLRVLLAVINQDVESVQQITTDDLPLSTVTQLQLALYLTLGMATEAHKVYRQWKEATSYLALVDRLEPLLERNLLKLHMKTGNEAGVQELLEIAKKHGNKELIELYDNFLGRR